MALIHDIEKGVIKGCIYILVYPSVIPFHSTSIQKRKANDTRPLSTKKVNFASFRHPFSKKGNCLSMTS